MNSSYLTPGPSSTSPSGFNRSSLPSSTSNVYLCHAGFSCESLALGENLAWYKTTESVSGCANLETRLVVLQSHKISSVHVSGFHVILISVRSFLR